jgi:hypothetical protein
MVLAILAVPGVPGELYRCAWPQKWQAMHVKIFKKRERF